MGSARPRPPTVDDPGVARRGGLPENAGRASPAMRLDWVTVRGEHLLPPSQVPFRMNGAAGDLFPRVLQDDSEQPPLFAHRAQSYLKSDGQLPKPA